MCHKMDFFLKLHVRMPLTGILLARGLVVQQDDGDYFMSMGFQEWCAIAILLKKIAIGDKDRLNAFSPC